MTRRAAFVASAAAFALSGCSREYRIEQTSGNTRATLTTGVYPLVVGQNVLKVELADLRGNPLPADTRVEVRYGLPPMPGMGSVDGVAETSRDGNTYVFTAEIHTRARWHFHVLVRRTGQPESRLSFALNTL